MDKQIAVFCACWMMGKPNDERQEQRSIDVITKVLSSDAVQLNVTDLIKRQTASSYSPANV